MGLVVLGWLAPGLNQVALAQTATVCHAAAVKGVDGPIDYGAYCWIDFSPLILSQAKNASGQNFRVNLQGGAYLTFTLRIIPGNTAGANMYARPVPSWTGAAFGNSAFNSIPGNPILYQDQNNQNNPRDTVTLSSITLHANGSTDLPFVFVAGDGESSNGGESLSFTTTGQAWTLISAPGQSNPGLDMPTLTPATAVGNSTGSQTVDIDGVDGDVGSYVFTTDNSPGTVTAELEGNGLQGVIFGLKYHSIGLSLTKSHVGNFVVGGTGTYTIDVANTVVQPQVNPPSEPQPVRVVDTLPAGLTYASASGTGWSCSNVGQIVTCNTTALQDLTYTRTFPPISINVTVDNNATSPLVNSAVVSDPTTTTLVFNVCETENNGVCPNSATNTHGDETIILRPDLSGSIKTVADLNGGDVERNDMLRYTITLVETGGVAVNGVSVSDELPGGLTGLTGLNTTLSTCGGVAGVSSGVLTVTGINLAASSSCVLVFDAQVSASAGDGFEITNVATVTNPSGLGATTPEVTVVVAQSQVPEEGNKILYLYNTNNGSPANYRYLSRTPQSASGNVVRTFTEGGSGDTHDFRLTPVLAAPLVLIAGTTVNIDLVVRRTGTDTSAERRTRTVRAQLYKRVGGTETQIGQDAISFNATGDDAFHVETLSFAVPNNANRSLAAGNQLMLRIINESSGNGTRTIELHPYTGGMRSTVSFDTSTVINVDSVKFYSNRYNLGAEKTEWKPGETVYIRAVVSDPFGSFDIAPSGGVLPMVTLKDATGNIVLNGVPMTQVADSGAATKTFEYRVSGTTGHILAASAALGYWTASVTATEGTTIDPETITHTANGSFNVEGIITLGKIWSGATAGNAVSLAIAGGTSAAVGTSTAPSTTTAATATSGAGATLTLSEAFTVGLAGDYTAALACVTVPGSNPVAVSGSALSRTITMPANGSVNCMWTNARTLPLTVVKLATVYSDPINGTTDPKMIPGALVTYLIIVTSPAETQADADSVVISDTLPAQTALFVNDLPDEPGTGPFGWLPNGSNMTFTFGGLGATDDVEFSNDNGTSWSYEPVPDGEGVDAAVTNVRFHPKGTFAPGENFRLGLRVKIE